MKKSEAISLLKSHEAALKQLGAEQLYLFGSTARDEAAEIFDVDLFFDYPDDNRSAFSISWRCRKQLRAFSGAAPTS